MADVTTTAITVPAGTPVDIGVAGATLTAGMPVYKDAAASNVLKGATTASTTTATIVGITLGAGTTGQHICYLPVHARGTVITVGAVLTDGVFYCVSDNAGGVAPFADVAGADLRTILGMATSTTTLRWNVDITGDTA